MTRGPATRATAPRRRARILLPVLVSILLPGVAPVAAAEAEPGIRILDLPFRVLAMRGPRSEAAVAVATSGLLPVAGAPTAARVGQPAGDEESAPIALVWGDDGGAVLALSDGTVTIRPIGRDAVEGLTAAETPRGALPGLRRALSGPLSAYLTGRARAPDGREAAAVLTIRERQPLAVSTEPKPVPISTATVPAGQEAVFALLRPRLLRLAGRPALLAATLSGSDAGELALIARPAGAAAGTATDAPGGTPAQAPGGTPANAPGGTPASTPAGAWGVAARTPPQPGPPLKIAAVADFSGSGDLQAATVSAQGRLQLWTLRPDRIEPAGEAAGYEAGEGDVDLAALIRTRDGPGIVLPVAGRAEIAVVALNGPPRERLRVALPAPAGTGIVVLGEGPAARLLVGLADGRVAAVALDGGKP